MLIEKLSIQLKPHKAINLPDSVLIKSEQSEIKLSKLQFSYFEILAKGFSIESMVEFFMGQGWLVSFKELYSLIQNLLSAQMILNKEFYIYFAEIENKKLDSYLGKGTNLDLYQVTADAKTGKQVVSVDLKAIKKAIREFPFFRNLPENLVDLFINNSRLLALPANVQVIKEGDKTRELYVLLEGSVNVYKSVNKSTRQLLATLPVRSIFGETGFFLNKPRSADVVTGQACQMLQIRYSPEAFGPMINQNKAESLQVRFWVLHALQSADFFKLLPDDTYDQIIYAGKILSVPAQTVLLKEGQAGNSFYIIVQGTVAFSQKGKLLRHLKQGDSFGEIALMASGGVRTATATAESECVIMEVPQREFYQILSRNLVIAKSLEEQAHSRYMS